ncbi:MAG TPA: hypothetical protein VLR46_09825 [Candidatus Dormibacteraeota bacterium]|nr:hypothetical protein [Candidatus Dormibacteraeota bacterium]
MTLLVVNVVGFSFSYVFRGPVARVAPQHPPPQSDNSQCRDKKREAQSEPTGDPFPGEDEHYG